MSAPLLPTPLDEVRRRPFAFYPSILHADPNVWMAGSATWAEVEMVNARTGQKIWVPRQYIGAVSEADDPILMVGLTKELEYREGAVRPRVKRVIEMPPAVNGTRVAAHVHRTPTPGTAAVVNIRLERKTSSPGSRILVAAGVGAVTLSLLAAGVFADWISSGRSGGRPVARMGSSFTARDTYATVVHKLGAPGYEREHADSSGRQFRALVYPHRRVTVILTGRDKVNAQYVGIMTSDGRILHSVPLEHGPDSAALLAALPRF